MEPVKDYKWLITAVAAALLAVLVVYFGVTIQNPTPVPSPTPTPVASASPSPSATPPVTQSVLYRGLENAVSPVPPLAGTTALSIARGETRGFFVKSTSCMVLTLIDAPAGVTLQGFRPVAITTTSKSYKTATLGAYYDPLILLKSGECIAGDAWVDIIVDGTVAPGTYQVKIVDLPVSLKVNSLTMPARPSVPMYAGLMPYKVLQGHKLPGTTGVDVQGPLVKKYADLMRLHRIEPYGQSPAQPQVLNGKLNLDNWSDLGGSFRQTVMNGAIAPVALATFSDNVTASWLAAAQASIAAEPALSGAWYYVQDEPQAADLAGVITKLQAARASAPSLKTMVTHEPWSAAVGLLDSPTPAMQLWAAQTQFPQAWIYGACPAHGSCANGFLGDNIGIPDLMIDQPSINWRMYPLVALPTDAKAVLYYAVNESFGQIDPWTNVYLFGGNGDGTLMYPGITGDRGFTDHTPVASVRMKLMRQGSFDLEYLRRLPKSAWAAALPGPTGWTKSHAAIDALRDQAAP